MELVDYVKYQRQPDDPWLDRFLSATTLAEATNIISNYSKKNNIYPKKCDIRGKYSKLLAYMLALVFARRLESLGTLLLKKYDALKDVKEIEKYEHDILIVALTRNLPRHNVIAEFLVYFKVCKGDYAKLLSYHLLRYEGEKDYAKMAQLLEDVPEMAKEINYIHLLHVLFFIGRQDLVAGELMTKKILSCDRTANSLQEFMERMSKEVDNILTLSDEELSSKVGSYCTVYKAYAAGILAKAKRFESIKKCFGSDLLIEKLCKLRQDDENQLEANEELSKLRFIQTASELAEIAGLLEEKVVALDCEWKPSITPRPTIVQIASANHFVILDIEALISAKEFVDFMSKLFQSKKIVKVGHSFLRNDFQHLNTAYDVSCFSELRNFVDIGENTSLKTLVQIYLGKEIGKQEQMSDWSRRPLSLMQMHYAIMDSIAILRIYNTATKSLLSMRLKVNH